MNGKILNVPIFIAEYIDKLIQIEEQNNGGRKIFNVVILKIFPKWLKKYFFVLLLIIIEKK